MLERVRDFINAVPKQPQLQCSTSDQVRGLIVICKAFGLNIVEDNLDRIFQRREIDVSNVIDLRLLLNAPCCENENAPATSQYLMAIAVANRFGLYDAADFIRLSISGMQ